MSHAAIAADPLPIAARVVALRDAFDRSFADPPAPDTAAPPDDVIAIRIGEEAFAIRLSEIAGLHAGKTITRVPGGDPALLGVAGFRGTILAVYSAAILLGRAAQAPPRWLVIAAAAPVAFAFDSFERHLRLPAGRMSASDAGGADRRFVRAFMPAEALGRPILHLPAIIAAIGTRPAAPAAREER